MISFMVDWFDPLAFQGSVKSLLQHHSLKVSILWHYAFFMVQFSQLYMATGKTIALTIRTFVGKVMPLLFNTLSTFVIAFLPRNNHLLFSWCLISWYLLITAVTICSNFRTQEEKICHCFHLLLLYSL